MDVIAVLNQKGGAGKTTASTNLARAFQVGGAETLLVDGDPQGSARDYAAVDPNNPLTTVGLDRPTVDRDLKRVAPKVDVVVIDGAPQAHDLAVSAIKAATLVLIPVQPSPYDIWATAALVELVHQRIEITDGALKAAFFINRAIIGTNISKEIFETLAGYNLPILKTVINQRIIFPESAKLGKSVLDVEPNNKAAAEILALRDEIRAFIAGETLATGIPATAATDLTGA